MASAEQASAWPDVERRILERRLAAGVHADLAARAAERISANTSASGAQAWSLRNGDHTVGTAWTHARDGRSYLADLHVSVDQAPEALAALVAALSAQGLELLVLDVPAGDEVAAAAVDSAQAALQGTQMQLDLSAPVGTPPRVTLRRMSEGEFATYREQLVSSYAQDLFDSGAFADLESATASSTTQTVELLPEGLDSAGHHLWTAYDDQRPVGVLWIYANGAAAFIYDIEVLPEQRRRGYGREMLDAGARAAVELGAEVLGLNVFGHNDGARALYASAGYATTEQTYRIAL